MRAAGRAQATVQDALPPTRKPNTQRAAAFAHDYLKALILNLKLVPGTVITEMDVAAATGLSRTPIREALLRLHEEGLVELMPRRGALIPWVTVRQIRDLYEVRRIMENHAIAAICAHRTPVAERLAELCDEQERLFRDGAGVPDLIHVDRQFHAALIAGAGNTVLDTVNDSLGDHEQRTGVMSFSLDRSRCQAAMAQHRQLAEALAVFDLDRARHVLEQHLVRGEHELELLLHPELAPVGVS